jgi:hypothetical protein
LDVAGPFVLDVLATAMFPCRGVGPEGKPRALRRRASWCDKGRPSERLRCSEGVRRGLLLTLRAT